MTRKIKWSSKAWNWTKKLFKQKQDETWFLTDAQIIKVTKEELIFIYNHSEKELKDTIDTGSIITTKTTTLLTVTVGLLAALIGYSMNRWATTPKFDSFMVSACVGCAYLFVLGIILSFNIIPRVYFALGGDPKVFFNENLFHYEDVAMRMKMYYINEIESYSRRTNKNIKVNRERQNVYKVCYILLVLTPVGIMLAFIVG
jgi:hypothetical protein